MALTSLVRCRSINILKTSLTSSIQCSSGRSSLVPARYLSVTKTRNMKLVQFTYPETPNEVRAGVVVNNKVLDINKADKNLPSKLIDILRNGQIEQVKKLDTAQSVPLDSVCLKAPISNMDKVICIGLNYKDHCEEQKLTPPEVPMFFSKFASSVVGPCDAVKLRTEVTKCVDWEVELVVVIGRTASNVTPADALSYVLGYTVGQDISARDWQKQRNGGQFLLGKAPETFCPIGPWIVTSDEIANPESLDIKCSVDGVLKQSSNTCQLVHKIPDAIARLSSVMTLLPGDIIMTGTPGGVGMYRNPPEYLKPGTVIESVIQNIGVLTTKCEKF